MEFVELLREFGPLAGLVLVFIIREWRREDRLNTRIEKLEKDQQDLILPLLTRTTEVITENTTVMKEVRELFHSQVGDGKRESSSSPAASPV